MDTNLREREAFDKYTCLRRNYAGPSETVEHPSGLITVGTVIDFGSVVDYFDAASLGESAHRLTLVVLNDTVRLAL